MILSFTKMHGLGNDFIVLDNMAGSLSVSAEQIRQLSNRKFGIGFDQLLIVERPSIADAEFDYRIYNADGGEVEHCGNGARCFAIFVKNRGLTQNDVIRVNTASGVITLVIQPDNQVTVAMGIPTFEPARIPFKADAGSLSYPLDVDGQTIDIGVVAIGNPHAVILVNDVDTAPVETLGPLIESHPRFPNRVNVGFMQILDRQQIKLRVFERGVGETLACGTGACAAVAVGQAKNLLDKSVVVSLGGGDLNVSWSGSNYDIEMTGPCTTVFEGHIRM